MHDNIKDDVLIELDKVVGFYIKANEGKLFTRDYYAIEDMQEYIIEKMI